MNSTLTKLAAEWKPVFPAWFAFLAASAFCCLIMPTAEGLDELDHLGYIQYVAQAGSLPLVTNAPFPPYEIDLFLQHHPVGWSIHLLDSTPNSYEDYWNRAPQEREAADTFTTGLHFSGSYLPSPRGLNYQDERHQPPLYYLLTAPVFALISRHFSFVHTFLIIRLFSALIASLVVPAAFALAQALFANPVAAETVAALVVLFPGLYPGVVRIAPDCLVTAAACWTLVFLFQFLKTGSRAAFWSLSACSVIGLWSKAYAIPILFGAVIVIAMHGRLRAAGILLLISLLGSPWYAFNFVQTGSLTGLPETVGSNASLLKSVRVLPLLDWGNLVRVARSSHIWVGNSSMLSVRTWMYQVIAGMFLLALAGLAARWRRQVDRPVWALVVMYAVFAASLVYFATQVFQRTGASLIQGWYLSSMLSVEAVLFIAGMQLWMRRNWHRAAAVLALFMFALWIYTAVFVAMPYYSGFTAHNASGHLTAYHPVLRHFPMMSARLLRFYSAVPNIVPWLLLTFFTAFAASTIIRLARAGQSAE